MYVGVVDSAPSETLPKSLSRNTSGSDDWGWTGCGGIDVANRAEQRSQTKLQEDGSSNGAELMLPLLRSEAESPVYRQPSRFAVEQQYDLKYAKLVYFAIMS